MKRFAVLAALCALTQTAHAQAPECRALTDPIARLACYDRAAPPAVSTVPIRPQPRTAPLARTAPPSNADPISAEDAIMDARMKNICRGC